MLLVYRQEKKKKVWEIEAVGRGAGMRLSITEPLTFSIRKQKHTVTLTTESRLYARIPTHSLGMPMVVLTI